MDENSPVIDERMLLESRTQCREAVEALDEWDMLLHNWLAREQREIAREELLDAYSRLSKAGLRSLVSDGAVGPVLVAAVWDAYAPPTLLLL